MKVDAIIQFLTQKGIDYQFCGDSKTEIIGYSSLKNYRKGTMTWIGRLNAIPDRFNRLNIDLAIIERDLDSIVENGIYVRNSKAVFFNLIEHFFETKKELPDRGINCYIGHEVSLGRNVKIGHMCVLDGDIRIGDNTVIYNNVNIVNRVTIGKDCVIQSGVSIGHDGFGYSEDEYNHKTMIPHHGGVVIGDNVYISANTVIQRGTIDDTVIEAGTKIDTLCHIAHNVHLGNDNSLITMTAMYGSSETGQNCYIASSIVKDNISIGNQVQVGMNSVVMSNTGDSQVLVGTPARKLRDIDR